MRLPASLAVVSLGALLASLGTTGCQSLGAPDRAATTAVSSAVATSLDGAAAADACAESLAAFTAADVRARLDAHAVVARVEPGLAARADRLGLTCEGTLEVTWREVEAEGGEERGERVHVVARRHEGGELAVLVHEAVSAPREAVADSGD